MAINPVGQYILAKKTENEPKTAGGILLPIQPEEQNMAIVIAVGSGRTLKSGEKVPVEVLIGDEIFFDKNALGKDKSGGKIELVKPVNFRGETYLMIHEDAILAVVE